MLSTNMPQLVEQLYALHYDVKVQDVDDSIILHLPASVDIHEADELLCDAVFADPAERVMDRDGWSIFLIKRSINRRPCAELHVKRSAPARFSYVITDYAA